MNREFELAEPHADWLELCALATAGALTPAEEERLRSHLPGCVQCRAVLSEYRAVARQGMPFVADEYAPSEEDWNDLPEWDAHAGRQRLFANLDVPVPGSHRVNAAVIEKPRHARRLATIVLGTGLAASLLVAVSVGSYRWGRRSVHAVAPSVSPLQAQVQSLTAEKASLDRKLNAQNASLAAFEKQTAEHQNEIAKLQAQLQDAQTQTNAVRVAKTAGDQQLQSAIADRDALAAKLQAAEQSYQSVQTELTNLKMQREQDLLHYASLEVQVRDLGQQLHETQSRVSEDTQYLASDRDIRELMGARQLYIADVVDVDQNGDRRKPFGRVFYTRGKSLIFYAFDLDRQPGVHAASIFQAWAREGSDKAQPVSLGIFYVDSEANRRWALKTSDPKVLAQVNSVFVTVEPKGGSEKPTSKPLLYAYLKTETPNHP